MPRVIVGLGSESEAAWAFPFSAKIADGFAFERLTLSISCLKLWRDITRRVIERVFRAIGNVLRRQSPVVRPLVQSKYILIDSEGRNLAGGEAYCRVIRTLQYD